jgi:hypothetical protein
MIVMTTSSSTSVKPGREAEEGVDADGLVILCLSPTRRLEETLVNSYRPEFHEASVKEKTPVSE